MALTWEKWRELFKGKWADVFEDAGVETGGEVTPESFQGILPISKGGTSAETAAGARRNLNLYIHEGVNTETVHNYEFWKNLNGVVACFVGAGHQGLDNNSGLPNRSNHVISSVDAQFGSVFQIWSDYYGHSKYFRSGNNGKWMKNGGIVAGKDAFVKLVDDSNMQIRYGYVYSVTIPKNSYLDIEIPFNFTFSDYPLVMSSCSGGNAAFLFVPRVQHRDLEKTIIRVNTNATFDAGIHVHWFAIHKPN